MIRIIAGEVYSAERVRSGNSGHGDWKLIVIKDNRDELTLWLTNPSAEVTEGGEFRIKSIESFDKKRVPYKEGKICRDRNVKGVEWRTECTANVTVEPVGFTEMPFTFDELPELEGEENPFESYELPL